MWMEDEGCIEMIESTWRDDFPRDPMKRVEGKILRCQSTLMWWSLLVFGNVLKKLREIKNEQLKKPIR